LIRAAVSLAKPECLSLQRWFWPQEYVIEAIALFESRPPATLSLDARTTPGLVVLRQAGLPQSDVSGDLTGLTLFVALRSIRGHAGEVKKRTTDNGMADQMPSTLW
jgi:hypothetical protein